MIFCNSRKCQRNDGVGHCGLKDISLVLCQSDEIEKLNCQQAMPWQKEDIESIMQVANPNCHREGNKFKANHITVLK